MLFAVWCKKHCFCVTPIIFQIWLISHSLLVTKGRVLRNKFPLPSFAHARKTPQSSIKKFKSRPETAANNLQICKTDGEQVMDVRNNAERTNKAKPTNSGWSWLIVLDWNSEGRYLLPPSDSSLTRATVLSEDTSNASFYAKGMALEQSN